MGKENKPQSQMILFQEKTVRRAWHEEQWYFSVIDIVAILAESTAPSKYWTAMKRREPQLSTICRQLKMASSDGKFYKTDVVSTQEALRLIQSVPSKKAEPFKLWLAKMGQERLEEIENPELAMERMKSLYEQKGYPKEWIEKRTRGIAVRQELTDEWKDRGAQEGKEYAILTHEIHAATFNVGIQDHKDFKGLANRHNLRDHMTDLELILTMLGEATATKIHQDRHSHGFDQLKQDAKEAGEVAGNTRKDIEQRTHKRVVSTDNYLALEGQAQKKLQS
jgi:DNA-damage-inducible protein D